METALLTQLKSIAGELDAGMACYLHRQTGELIAFPDPDKFADIDLDDWQAERALVDADPDAYIPIRPMSSRESFGIMEQFVEELPAGNIRDQLRNVLGRTNPFKGLGCLSSSQTSIGSPGLCSGMRGR